MTTETKKNKFPLWAIPLVALLTLAFVVLFGPTIAWINALAMIVAAHFLAGGGAWFISRTIENDPRKNLSIAAGVFLLLVSVSFVLQLWQGFYTPIFELFVEIGELGRSIAKLGLFCSSGLLILVAVCSAVFGLNWKRVAKAIASQPRTENK